MVGLIDEMEAAGWLRRHRSAQARAFKIRLTQVDAVLVSRVNRMIPALEKELGHGLDDRELETMVALLKQLAHARAEPGDTPAPRRPPALTPALCGWGCGARCSATVVSPGPVSQRWVHAEGDVLPGCEPA